MIVLNNVGLLPLLAAALVWIVPPSVDIGSQPPTLFVRGSECGGESAACTFTFSHPANLAPGGAPSLARGTVTFHGSSPAKVVLFVQDFASRDTRSAAACLAANPAAGFDFEVLVAGQDIYRGTVDEFAQRRTAAAGLVIPSTAGEWWRPGATAAVSIAVWLDHDVGNVDMGCAIRLSLAWFAE